MPSRPARQVPENGPSIALQDLPMSDALLAALDATRGRIGAASGGRSVTLVAVSKTRPPGDVQALARHGQRDFGENYVQEALPKIAACADLPLTWHFIGPLQSNKAREVAMHFDWVQSVDRPKLVEALARHRPPNRGPLDVLLQVNIDDETSKSGCRPGEVDALARRIAAEPLLRLRGLMAIPDPARDAAAPDGAFARLRRLFDALRAQHPGIDTLSMGMSGDYVEAIGHGATMVRVGSALFGPRPPRV